MNFDYALIASELFSTLAAATAALSVVLLVYQAFRKSKISINFSSDQNSTPLTEEDIKTLGDNEQTKRSPFEIKSLADYYNQALSRANISFWFSLIFASIGFGVIIFSFITHVPGDLSGTAIKLISGTIIDAVASLFFVQSTRAQKSMEEFFNKLRLDRMNAEAREMISEIENSQLRDELRSQLILKYSAIDKLLVGPRS